MSDPERLLDESADEFERSLLRAADADAGSTRAQARCIAAAAGAIAVAAPVTASAAGSSLTLVAAIKGAGVGLAIAIGASSIASIGVPTLRDRMLSSRSSSSIDRRATAQTTRSAPPSRPAAAATARTASSSAQSFERAAAPREPTSSMLSRAASDSLDLTLQSPRGSVTVSNRGPDPIPTPPPGSAGAAAATELAALPPAVGENFSPPTPSDLRSATPEAPDRLQREVRQLDAARRALNAGQARRALNLLEQHDRESPHGSLAPEALVIRVQALRATGAHTAAAAAARAFLARHPDGAHAQRLRRILETNP